MKLVGPYVIKFGLCAIFSVKVSFSCKRAGDFYVIRSPILWHNLGACFCFYGGGRCQNCFQLPLRDLSAPSPGDDWRPKSAIRLRGQNSTQRFLEGFIPEDVFRTN